MCNVIMRKMMTIDEKNGAFEATFECKKNGKENTSNMDSSVQTKLTSENEKNH